MKTRNLLLTFLLSVVFVFGVCNIYAHEDKKNKKEKKTIVLKAEIHCKSCKAKLEKNIPFEKGVRDLKVDMKAKTITVVYRADKNNKNNIIKAIEKLGINVFDNDTCDGKCGDKCCKVTGDKSKCCKHGHHHHEKCDKDHSKDHKHTGDCKDSKKKDCKKSGKKEKCDCKEHKKDCKGKDQKCSGDCKTCKHEGCKKAGKDAKCEGNCKKSEAKKDKKSDCSKCSH